MSAGLQRLFDALTKPLPPKDLVGAQLRRRTEAVVAIAAYCGVTERHSTRVTEARRPPPPPELQQAGSYNQGLELLRTSVSCDKDQRLKRCFICIGQALTLPADDPNLPDLCRNFSGYREASRHFNSQHLSRLAPDTRVRCPVCPKVVLKHRDHFRNHAERVHGIRTATAKCEPTNTQWYEA